MLMRRFLAQQQRSMPRFVRFFSGEMSPYERNRDSLDKLKQIFDDDSNETSSYTNNSSYTTTGTSIEAEEEEVDISPKEFEGNLQNYAGNWINKQGGLQSDFLQLDSSKRSRSKKTESNGQAFRDANQDPLELALNPDVLRMYVSPTGRIQPRRFTGLTAKEQRKLQRAIKRSQQLALLPFCSKYPEPSVEQMINMGREMADDHYVFDEAALEEELKAIEEEQNRA